MGYGLGYAGIGIDMRWVFDWDILGLGQDGIGIRIRWDWDRDKMG
jgi:hypothetical protein